MSNHRFIAELSKLGPIKDDEDLKKYNARLSQLRTGDYLRGIITGLWLVLVLYLLKVS